MFVDWFLLVLVVFMFVVLYRDNVRLDEEIGRLMMKVHQLEHHVPLNLDDVDTALATRVRKLEHEIFPQPHQGIDYSKLNYIYARLWDLEDRVEAIENK
ncbi:hypothetical protein N9U03_00140 [bacterium]|nr:hypothetical protein [bacterium]